MDGLCQPPGEHLRAHRQRDLVDHLTRPGSDDRRTEHLPAERIAGDRLRSGDELDEALGTAVGDGTIHLRHRELGHPATVVGRLRLGHPDPRELWVRERRPWNPRRPESTSQPLLEGIARGQSTHLVGRMRERQLAGDVADGVHTAHVGLEPIVGHDVTPLIELHAELLEAHSARIGNSTDCEHETLDDGLTAGGDESDALGSVFDALDRRPGLDGHAVGNQRLLDHGRRVGLFSREKARESLEETDRHAEAGERLGELTADRPAADDAETGRPRNEREDRLVGEHVHVDETWDRRHARPPAGGDDDARSADTPITDHHGVMGDEAGPPLGDFDTLLGQHIGRLRCGDTVDGVAHAGHGLAERQPLGGRREQRLRRDAPGEGAVASQRTVVHQEHIGPGPASSPSGPEPPGASPDDDQIVIHRAGNRRRRGAIPPS